MKNFLEQYSRTILLKEVGFEGQVLISKASVLVIGAGGLGSAVLPFLVSTGIFKVGIIDYGKLELSNLQRQILFKHKDIGKAKVNLAKDFLQNLNSEVKVETFEIENSTDNYEQIKEIALNYDAIVDLTDTFESRINSNKLAIFLKKPFFTGACVGFNGHVYSFAGYLPEIPCYVCLFGEEQSDAQTCENSGIFPPCAGVVGSLIAVEILKFFAVSNYKNFGKFILIDFLKETQFKEIRIKKDTKCKTCC